MLLSPVIGELTETLICSFDSCINIVKMPLCQKQLADEEKGMSYLTG